MAQLANWKLALRTAIVEAAGRTDEGPLLSWIQLVEENDTTLEHIADSGKEFAILDRKLAGSLRRIISSGCPELAREVSSLEQEQNKHHRVLKGRQMYWMILRNFQTNANLNLLYGIQHFANLRWLGDKRKRDFLAIWKQVEALQRDELPERNRAEMLLEQLEQSHDLALEMQLYRNSMYARDGQHDYRQLIAILEHHIRREAEQCNNKALMSAITGSAKPDKTEVPVNTATDTTPCRKGAECKNPKCAYKHPKGWKPGGGGAEAGGKAPNPKSPKADPKGKAKGQGKGEGRSKTPPPASTDSKKVPCFKFNMGLCKKSGQECKFAHRKVLPEEQSAFDKYKAEAAVAKAAAKQEAKAKAAAK
jgi:hypothetical protein